MKRLLHLVVLLFISINLLAQAPQKMTYQAVIRNASNNLVVNAPVKMKISILQGSISGTAVYSELHNPTTNANGLVSIEIGSGTSPVGTIGSINWGNGTYFLKTETDPTNGTNYSIEGTSQLLSVPYALYSSKADSSKIAGNGINKISPTGDTVYLVNGDKYIIPGIRKIDNTSVKSNCVGNLGTPNPWSFPTAFDGGYIPLGNFGAQTKFSISMWINPNQTQNGVSIILDASHGGSSNWVIQTLNSGATWTWGAMEFTLTPNSWQHLLLTYDNGNRKLYINGDLITSLSQVISYSGSPNLYLGNWPEGARRFAGFIDELYITKDIQQTTNFTPIQYINNPSANTFGLWHFDEGTGANTFEQTTNSSFAIGSWFWSTRQ